MNINGLFILAFATAVTKVGSEFVRAHGKHHDQTFLGASDRAHAIRRSEPIVEGNQSKGQKSLIEPEHHVNPNLKCGLTVKVGAHTDKNEDCPGTCPYFAQNRNDAAHCTFVCVRKDECATMNANKPIADTIRKSSTCRGPVVEFCSEPNLDGSDTCRVCQGGFKLYSKDGKCYFQHWTAIIATTVVVLVIVAFALVWVVDLCCRPSINEEQVDLARQFRSRAKIHMAKEDMAPGERRHTWPIDTNLCTTDVAGPGMMLHFNFQAFLIVWPFLVAVLWTVISCFYNELFVLGTRKFGTPRHNCILVAWGYETQQSLMWTKVLFIFVVYVFSVLGCFLLAVWQHRLMQQTDAKEKTMKNFAAELKGLPEMSGRDANIENALAEAVHHATLKRVVGVSVAWNFQTCQDAVVKAVKKDQAEREEELGNHAVLDDISDPMENMGAIHKMMYKAERYLLADGEDGDEENITEVLSNLVTTESAFVVFMSEAERDSAIEVLKENGLHFTHGSAQACTLTMNACQCEPATVNWHNFGDAGTHAMIRRLLFGFFTVYVPALLVWLFVFYVPYAWSIYNFNYANGAEPPGYFALLFTMIVVGGNAIMYLVCDICSDIIGFRFKDSKHTCYMIFYLFACMFNVFLDMVITWYMALKIAVGQDFRTYDGMRISEVEAFTDQFETYAMQRIMAENAYNYAFPSTFLVPFILEPIVTVLVPYQLGKIIIRTHKEIKGQTAEAYLAAFDFDLGRYADILLNVFLGILIFFFPGGYTWSLFYGMWISHIVIYAFDHWRVLNVIPAVKIVSSQVDWWAQVMLGACCSMILSALVFKANCESYSGYCYKDMGIVVRCSVFALIHFILHVLVLLYVVPCTGKKKVRHEHEDMTFEDVACNDAHTWFSTNPVHCLRSRFMRKDMPHCRFVSAGKEHLLQANRDIGCYFEDVAAASEDFVTSPSMHDLAKNAKRMSRSLTALVTQRPRAPSSASSSG